MWDMNDVVKITYRGDYVFHVAFDDGVAGDIDFYTYINKGPVFLPLQSKEFFRKATIEGGTIAWPNGADIAPETLYEKIICPEANLVPNSTSQQDNSDAVSAGPDPCLTETQRKP